MPHTYKYIYILLSIVLAYALFFGCVIRYLQKDRKRFLSKSLQLKASDFWPRASAISSDPADFLYAIVQDFSMTVAGLIVRDASDKEVARMVYHPIQRQGWITIETAEGRFEVDSLLTWQQTLVLRRATDAEPICTLKRSFLTRNYDSKHLGRFERKATWRSLIDTVFPITKDGTVIGKVWSINRAANQGAILVLPHAIPLPVRLFLFI